MKRPIEIVHVIHSLNRGGAEETLVRLAATMNPERFRTTVVVLTDDSGVVGAPARARGIRLVSLRAHHVVPLDAVTRLARFLRSEKPDVVQTWLYKADFIGTLAAKAARIPISLAWNVRGGEANARSRPLVGVLARLSRFPDLVVANSEAGRRYHEARGYRCRWRVLHNGVDTDRFSAPEGRVLHPKLVALGIGLDDFVVGLVARYDAVKDHATFVEAASIAAAACPDMRFVLVGREVDTSPELQEHITRRGLQARFRRFGDQADVEDFVRSFDVASLSSVSEGFPNVIGEAMACSIPCVVTDVGEAAYIVGDTGIVVPPRDPAALARGWETMYRLPADARRARGRAARLRIQRTFSMGAFVAAYEALYEELAESRRLPR